MKDSFSRREHIGWVDLLRVLACFLVVFAHCCDPFVGQLDADRGAFLTGAFAGSLVRCSVPLFVMMTGVLLLPVGEGMGAFYRRRIGRIVPPLLFWSLALPLAAGGAVGSAAGAFWLNRVPTRLLAKGFALFLLFSAWRMYVG